MKKALPVLLAAALLSGGCMNVSVSDERPVCAAASNYGWTLFGFIPLCCGNSNGGRWTPVTFFWNDVTEEKLEAALVRAAEVREMQVRDLAFEDRGTMFFAIPQCAFSLPIPYFITYREKRATCTFITDAEVKAGEKSLRLRREMKELLDNIPED